MRASGTSTATTTASSGLEANLKLCPGRVLVYEVKVCNMATMSLLEIV